MADIELKSLKFSEDGDVYYPLPIVSTNNTGQVLAVDYKGNWSVLDQRVLYEHINGTGDIVKVGPTPAGGEIVMSYNLEEDTMCFGDYNCKDVGAYLAIGIGRNTIEVSASPSTAMGVVNLAYLQSKFNELSDQHLLLPPADTSNEGKVLMVNSKGTPQWTAQALQNLGITSGTTDIGSGAELATGSIYFVHEE